MASPGIYSVNKPGVTAGTAQPQRRLAASGSAKFSRQEAALSGTVNLNGAATVAGMLVGLWALDRYVVNLPFIRATGAMG